MLEVEVLPEKGLTNGQLELILGMPLVNCTEMLTSNYTSVKDVQLSYSEQSPLCQEIVLDLINDGVKLLFDQKCQRLKTIEVYDTRKITLKYCSNVFSGPGITPTLELIRQCFGPTRAGDRNVRQQLFLLLFRGIVFIFPLWNTSNTQPIFDADDLEFTEPSIEGSLVLSKFCIFSGNNPLEAIAPPIPIECYQGGRRSYAESVQGLREEGANIINGLKIDLIHDNDESSTDSSHFERKIYFKDTPQDIMSTLGAPDKIYYKDKDKMRIHSSSEHKLPLSSTVSDYFYNYFTLGMDVLFDGVSHHVKKFILHTNFPGHYDFNMYHRCHFNLTFPDQQDTTTNDSLSQAPAVNTFTKWSDISNYLFHDNKSERPVVLSRSSHTNNTNPFGYTYCYNHHNVIFEVMKNSYIASVMIYNNSNTHQ